MSRPVLRTCVGCRTVRDRRELVRLAVDPAKGLVVNPPEVRGRGAYLCPAFACLEKAWHRKVFVRAFRRELPALDGMVVRERFEAELRRRGAPAAERAPVLVGKGNGCSREESRAERDAGHPPRRKRPR